MQLLRIPIVLALILGAPYRCTEGQQGPATVTAIVNVNVIAMDTEGVRAGQTVLVEGGIITRMGPARSTRAPAGAAIVDGRGKYLIPGMVDAHVHLSYNSPDEQRAILKLFLMNGVTTVLNLRGTPQMLELRAAVAAGSVLGPAIYTAGPYVNEPFFTTPDEVERGVVDQKRAGYDFIKFHGDLSREAYHRLNVVARREGIRVVGHAPRNLGLARMFEERQYALAHGEEFIYNRNNQSRNPADIEREIPELARSTAQAGIWLMPNLTGFKTVGWMVNDLDAVLDRPEMQLLPAAVRMGWGPETNPYTRRMPKSNYPGIMALFGVIVKLTGEFQAQGVRLLVGTDAMNTGVVPGFSVHDELAELVAAGLTPYQALRAATANAGEFLAAGPQRGIIAVGQNADLVLLDANPLETISNSRRIAGVMLRGRWFSTTDLVRMRTELRSTVD